MKVGDRVFVEETGAGHVVAFQRDERPVSFWFAKGHVPVTWIIVELDTGRRIPAHPARVKATT